MAVLEGQNVFLLVVSLVMFFLLLAANVYILVAYQAGG